MRQTFPRRLLSLLLALTLVSSLMPWASAEVFFIEYSNVGLKIGESKTINYRISQDVQDIKWKVLASSDGPPSDIATFKEGNTPIKDTDGNYVGNFTVRGDKEGTAVLQVTYTCQQGGTGNYVNKEKKMFITVGNPPPTVRNVTISKGTLTLEPGNTEPLSVTVTMSDGTQASNFDVAWSSGNNSVASVDQGGKVTALAAGTATITGNVTLDGKTAGTVTCSVTVRAASADPEITLSETSVNLSPGTSKTITATLEPAGTAGSITWSIDKPSIAGISSSGNSCTITAESAGTATVTARLGNASATCTVTVDGTAPSAPKITLSKDSTRLSPGALDTITATLTPAGTAGTIIWSTNNAAIAAITPSGNRCTITAGKTAGTAIVTATLSGDSKISAVCSVTVAEPTGLTIDPTVLSLGVGQTHKMNATLTGSGASTRLQWSSGNPAVATVNSTGMVTALSPGQTDIVVSHQASGTNAVCKLTVTAVSATGVDITTRATKNNAAVVERGSPRQFTASVYPSSAAQTVTWSIKDSSIATIDTVTGTVTGVKPGRTTVTATTADGNHQDSIDVEVSGIALSETELSLYVNESKSLSFPVYGNTPSTVTWSSINPSIADAVYGRVTGHYPGTTTITATAGAYTAECKVTVAEDVANAVNRTLSAGENLEFSSILYDLNRRCRDKTKESLSFVTSLSVKTGQGVLYYSYVSPDTPNHGVGGVEKYYYSPGNNQLSLSDITFVPKSDFSGVAVITYTGYNTQGVPFNGTIRVTVEAGGDITFSTAANQPVSFSAEAFSAMCKLRTGRTASYVTFTQPSSSRGALYYNYSASAPYSQKVDSNTRYYISSNPSVDQITFVPAQNYSGTVNITYHCTDTTGSSYTGVIALTVYSASGSSGSNVEYTTRLGRNQSLYAADFNSACRNATDSTLDYIRFTSLPASSAGTLYYRYTNSNSTRVTTGTRYYRSGSSNAISSITFVPASGYEGTVTIPFVGYNTAGQSFSASLVIQVSDNGQVSSDEIIHYTSLVNGVVHFSAADFNSACRAITGNSLSYVRFDLPSSSYGRLYYQYRSASSTGTQVTSGTSYYRSSSSGTRLLDDVSFAASGTSGLVRISYTGRSVGGSQFTGSVEINVTAPVINTISYSGSSTPIQLRASDFQSVCQTALGNPLSYIRFNSLPGYGQLTLDYQSSRQPGTAVASGTSYYVSNSPSIDRIFYLPPAEYQGQLTLSYTGYDTQGKSYTGSLEISVSNSYCPASFTDVPSGFWAAPSIEYLRYHRITTGYGNGTFRPNSPITRGEFTLMACRAFQFSGGSGYSFPDVPSSSPYAEAVSTARALGIVEGNDGLFRPDQPITRQSAMAILCRALEAAGEEVPYTSSTLLSAYSDGDQVSAHARSAVAALIQMDVVRGSADRRIKPLEAITRAQMAVILHRVLAR